MFHTRRQFLQTAVAAGTGLTLGSNAVSAIEPIPAQRQAAHQTEHCRLQLSPISRSEHQTETADDSRRLRRDRRRAWSRRRRADGVLFRRYESGYLAKLKGKCTRLGLDISGTAIGNNFCVTDPEKLKQQKAMSATGSSSTSPTGRQDHAHLRR